MASVTPGLLWMRLSSPTTAHKEMALDCLTPGFTCCRKRERSARCSQVEALVGRHSWCPTLPTIVRPRNLTQNPVGIAKVEFLAPVGDRLGLREIALQFLESRVD